MPLVPDQDEDVLGVRTFGKHPILFVYDPIAVWRELGRQWDVIDIHEEPYALATTQILILRWLRRNQAPFVMYSAQNIAKRYPPPFRWFERWALRHAAALTVCNNEAGLIAVRKGLVGLNTYIPLGLDTSRFSPYEKGPRDPDRLVVGYVGRLEAKKGVDVLLDAAEGDTRIHLAFAGGGPREDSLRKRVASWGDRVHFAGHLNQDQLTTFYRDLDVLAVPSTPTPTWLEQFGRVAVEAMASGVPVVASASGALPDVIGDAGLLVPPGDARALRAALIRILEQPELSARLRAAGPDRAAQFSWKRVGDDYVRLYRTITGQRPLSNTRLRAEQPRTIEVIVVAYGAEQMFAQAIQPLVPHYALTVVDNSSNPTIRALTEAAGGRYVDPGENRGFAAGVNLALAHRQVPDGDVLLLNPDAVINQDQVAELSRVLHSNPSLASVGPRQTDATGSPARVGWPFPSPKRAWLDAAGLGSAWAPEQFVIGSVLLLNGDALAEVGGFDEQFFLYSEEADWAYRAHRKAWLHAVVPSASAMHHGAGTGGDPELREQMFHASNEKYLRKHYGAAGWHLARAGVLVGSGARSVMLRGSARASAQRRFQLYLRGPVRSAAEQGKR